MLPVRTRASLIQTHRMSEPVFNADQTERDQPPGELPSQIGQYTVLGRLGDGATSVVFLARDEANQRDVAIKRLRLSSETAPVDAHFWARFFAATRTSSSCTRPSATPRCPTW